MMISEIETLLCMYVSMYVCMYVCMNTLNSSNRPNMRLCGMYVCVCMCMCACVCGVCIYVCMYVCMCRDYVQSDEADMGMTYEEVGWCFFLSPPFFFSLFFSLFSSPLMRSALLFSCPSNHNNNKNNKTAVNLRSPSEDGVLWTSLYVSATCASLLPLLFLPPPFCFTWSRTILCYPCTVHPLCSALKTPPVFLISACQ